MDQIHDVLHRIRVHLLAVVLLENLLIVTAYWLGTTLLTVNSMFILGGAMLLSIILSYCIMLTTSTFLIQPLKAIWQAVIHLHPNDQSGTGAPDVKALTLGKDLVENLLRQIYQLINVADKLETASAVQSSGLQHNFIASNLPIPLIILDDTETIQFVNEAAATYVGESVADLIGKNVYMVLDMLFPSEDTFDTWLKNAKQHSATATASWERVRLNVRDNHPTRLFDLATYYNKGNTQKVETMLVLFDHTKQYSQDDQAVSFMALSVHELRTPLTLLRGYIEVFSEELTDKVTPELVDFIQKMNASAQTLTAFVNNILNVARIDDDQLELKLQSGDWKEILQAAVDSIDLRASVRGVKLHCSVAPGLPAVGVDRLSIHEVINNIVDNAIKYSGESKVIEIKSQLSNDGLIETTVQDFGLGISATAVPNLFSKFYRDHRNRAQVGGTGLGLYLSKAIIAAHGGNIWVRSKEGEGSIFGFTLLPYSKLADEIKKNDDTDIVRGAHGWIKNHSLYRR